MLDNVLTAALSNAAAALVLAVIAALVGRLVRRPALTHGLWLLVLLKLLTPPLVSLPIAWPSQLSPAVVEASPAEEIVIRVAAGEDNPTAPALAVEAPAVSEPGPAADAPAAAGDSMLSLPGWTVLLASVWLAGSLGWLLLLGRRVRRMNGLLRFVRPAPGSLCEEVRLLASRLGLRREPTVWLVPGKLSPMLWSLGGRPRLLLPEELLGTLTAEQRATLLIHELAHLRRRDHWVRWLELTAMGLYWWNPVVWWARHELREAEELCCDGWVVWAMPGAGRAYAAALMECLDFLSGVPRPLPVGASGLGHIDNLKRRLKMIVSGTISRRLTWGGAAMLFGLGALLLPLVPAWSQDRKEEKPAGDRKTDPKEVEQAKAEVEKLRAELEEQVKKVKAVEEKLRAAASQLHKLEGKGGDVRILIIRDGELRGEKRIEFDRRIELQRGGDREREPGRGRPEGGDGFKREPGDRGGPERPTGPRYGDRPPGQGGDRMHDLERKLENIMRELEEMRRHMRQQGPSKTGGSPGGPVTGPRERKEGSGDSVKPPPVRREKEEPNTVPRSPAPIKEKPVEKPR